MWQLLEKCSAWRDPTSWSSIGWLDANVEAWLLIGCLTLPATPTRTLWTLCHHPPILNTAPYNELWLLPSLLTSKRLTMTEGKLKRRNWNQFVRNPQRKYLLQGKYFVQQIRKDFSDPKVRSCKLYLSCILRSWSISVQFCTSFLQFSAISGWKLLCFLTISSPCAPTYTSEWAEQFLWWILQLKGWIRSVHICDSTWDFLH